MSRELKNLVSYKLHNERPDLNKEIEEFKLGLNQLNRTIRELENEIKSNSIDKLECANMIKDANYDLYKIIDFLGVWGRDNR